MAVASKTTLGNVEIAAALTPGFGAASHVDSQMETRAQSGIRLSCLVALGDLETVCLCGKKEKRSFVGILQGQSPFSGIPAEQNSVTGVLETFLRKA